MSLSCLSSIVLIGSDSDQALGSNSREHPSKHPRRRGRRAFRWATILGEIVLINGNCVPFLAFFIDEFHFSAAYFALPHSGLVKTIFDGDYVRRAMGGGRLYPDLLTGHPNHSYCAEYSCRTDYWLEVPL